MSRNMCIRRLRQAAVCPRRYVLSAQPVRGTGSMIDSAEEPLILICDRR